MAEVVFEVEQAGCESCSARVRAALEPFGDVAEVTIDEEADSATVRAAGSLDEAAVNEALAAASHGSGHVYRVRPGSWQAA
jgi:copper chaperone CopZ